MNNFIKLSIFSLLTISAQSIVALNKFNSLIDTTWISPDGNITVRETSTKLNKALIVTNYTATFKSNNIQITECFHNNTYHDLRGNTASESFPKCYDEPCSVSPEQQNAARQLFKKIL